MSLGDNSSWAGAMFGKVFSSGVGIELGVGLNFTGGLRAVLNSDTLAIDITGGSGHDVASGELYGDLANRRSKLVFPWGAYESGVVPVDDDVHDATIIPGPVEANAACPDSLGLMPACPPTGNWELQSADGILAWVPARVSFNASASGVDIPADSDHDWALVGFAIPGIPDGALATATVVGYPNLVDEVAAGIIATEAIAQDGEVNFLIRNFGPDPVVGATINIFGTWIQANEE